MIVRLDSSCGFVFTYFYEDIKLFQESLVVSPGVGIESNREIEEACRRILSLKTFEGLSPDSLYLKIIQMFCVQ